MANLFIFNEQIESIFQLLGLKENNISYSVGYVLGNSGTFLENLLKHLRIKTPLISERIIIRLQKYEKDKGYTDFEIIQDNDFHIIIEAKRGWVFPTSGQLVKYATRPSFISSKAREKRIVIFNESTPAYTQANFGIQSIQNIPVEVISWSNLGKIATSSKSTGKIAENRLLNELIIYLNKISTMQKTDSNLVYVVSLGSGTPEKWPITWQDIVNKYSKYFHPVGGNKGGWPAEPPNYIAFRYNGKLQSIHHIDKYEVFTNPALHFPSTPKGNWGPHYLYHLGPAIRPEHEVKTGKKITRNLRVWAALDLLLTCQTIEDARDETQKR